MKNSNKKNIVFVAVLLLTINSYSLSEENSERATDKPKFGSLGSVMKISEPELPEWSNTIQKKVRPHQLSRDDYFPISTITKCITIINDKEQWNIDERNFIGSMDKVFCATALLGAIRNEEPETILALVEKMRHPSRFSDIPKLNDYFVTSTLVNIGIKLIDLIIKKIAIQGYDYCDILYFDSLFPRKSTVEILNNYLNQNLKLLNDNEQNNIIQFRKKIFEQKDKANLSQIINEYIQNHPLYKERQSAIDLNLLILKEQKHITELNIKTLNAIQKLGELRSVEAVDGLTPYLLLRSKTEIIKSDEKYIALKKYPVAISLAQIGIPSIRGLLKEIAKGKDEPEYIETAYKTMSIILPSVAILGFVDEAIENEKDQEAKKRLEKLYPLLPQQEEIKKRLNEKQEKESKER